MPKIKNATLLAECRRITDKMEWDKGAKWSAKAMAAVVQRVILTELGAKEYLDDSYKESRAEIVEIIAPCITAAINFQREYLVASGLAPEKAAEQKASELDLA